MPLAKRFIDLGVDIDYRTNTEHRVLTSISLSRVMRTQLFGAYEVMIESIRNTLGGDYRTSLFTTNA